MPRSALVHRGLAAASTALVVGLGTATPAMALPQRLSFGAYLYDTDGFAVDGGHDLRALIFDQPVGGTPLFAQTFPGAVVTSGLVSLTLTDDELTDLPDDPLDAALSLLPDAPRFVELQVDSVPLAPRWRIGSVPAAFTSEAYPAGGGLGWAELSSPPATLTAVAALGSCADGKKLAWDGNAWICGTDQRMQSPVAWAALAGMPSGVATLGSLSCGTGSVVKWGGGWVCGSDNPFSGTVDYSQIPDVPASRL